MSEIRELNAELRAAHKILSELRQENGRLRKRLEQCEQSNLTIAKVVERKEDCSVERQIMTTYPTPGGVVVEIREV